MRVLIHHTTFWFLKTVLQGTPSFEVGNPRKICFKITSAKALKCLPKWNGMKKLVLKPPGPGLSNAHRNDPFTLMYSQNNDSV